MINEARTITIPNNLHPIDMPEISRVATKPHYSRANAETRGRRLLPR
jgi:hypothetical protein